MSDIQIIVDESSPIEITVDQVQPVTIVLDNVLYVGNKQDKDEDAVNGNVGIFANGQTVDGGVALASLTGKIGGALGAVDNVVLRADGTGGATAQGSNATLTDSGALTLVSGTAATVPLTVNLASSQTANTVEMYNSVNRRIFSVSPSGLLQSRGAGVHILGNNSDIDNELQLLTSGIRDSDLFFLNVDKRWRVRSGRNTYEFSISRVIGNNITPVMTFSYTAGGGVAFSEVVGLPSFATVSLPTAGTAGRLAFDSTLGDLVVDNGTAWRQTGTKTRHFFANVPADGAWNGQTIPIWQCGKDSGVTITQVNAAVLGASTPTLAFNIEKRPFNAAGSPGTDLIAADAIADGDGVQVTSFAVAAVAALDYLMLTTAAESGTVTAIVVTVHYEVA